MTVLFLGFPGQASTFAGPVDTLFVALLGLATFIATAVCALIVYFGVKYRRGSPADRTGANASHVPLEIAWTVVPLLLAMGAFGWGARLYFDDFRPPARAIEIAVVGRQWMWQFQHPEGQREINELHVPLGRPIKLTMTSQDVIHSLYVPAFRVKQDVLPGRYTVAWFQATQTGEYRLLCTQYCGTDHAVMGGRVIVMDPAQYEQWLQSGNTGQTAAQQGEQLFRQFGCSGCHRMDGSGQGPPLVGIYGKPVPLQGGGTTIADDRYLRDSILLPSKDVAAGYPNIMPSFQGQLGEDDLLLLITYIKSLGGDGR